MLLQKKVGDLEEWKVRTADELRRLRGEHAQLLGLRGGGAKVAEAESLTGPLPERAVSCPDPSKAPPPGLERVQSGGLPPKLEAMVRSYTDPTSESVKELEGMSQSEPD